MLIEVFITKEIQNSENGLMKRIIEYSKDIAKDLKVPNSNWGKVNRPEPITNSYPEFGSGGGTQAITNKAIEDYKLIKLSK